MKKFAYKAIQANGQTTEGEVEVKADSDLQLYFSTSKLTPVRVKEVATSSTGSKKKRRFRFRQRRLFESELIAFTRQFAAAYSAGMGVSKVLDLLAKQTPHEGFREALLEVSDRIRAGKGLTEALREHPDYFEKTYCAILHSGEISGNLDNVMNYCANMLEKKLMHEEKIRSTFLYPKLVVGMIVITVAVVVIFVIPQFAKLYDKFEAPLPTPTLMLVKFSNVVSDYWWVWAPIIPLAPFIKAKLQKMPKFMLWFHEIMIDTPLLGPTFQKIELTHFCTTFALLLRSGIRITEAARIAIESMGNSFMAAKMLPIIPAIEEGGTLAKALEPVTVVPPLMTSMIAIGEESGSLDGLLDRVSSLYDHETDMMLKKLPTLLEPIILSFLFCLVFMLALAIYMPMWKMATLVRR